MIKGLHHIAIICSDKQKSLAFYVDALGFKAVRTHVRPEHHDEIIMLEGYGVVLELFADNTHPPRVTNPEALGLRHLALWVCDVEALSKSLLTHGFCPEQIRRDSFTNDKMTFVKDPDGLPIELHE